jgi:hypothetical protein
VTSRIVSELFAIVVAVFAIIAVLLFAIGVSFFELLFGAADFFLFCFLI